ncbi:MAG: hypothetical protein AAGL23_01385 [Pseudomonadota bacterium]
MAVAVRMGRLAAILIVDDKVLAWAMSDVAVKDERKTGPKLRQWISKFKPNLLISENPDQPGAKGETSVSCLKIIADVFDDRPERSLMLIRRQKEKNRYEEAARLAELYPDIACELPAKPPCWDKENPKLVFFEALAMAHRVVHPK